jgi:hypothetical protein
VHLYTGLAAEKLGSAVPSEPTPSRNFVIVAYARAQVVGKRTSWGACLDIPRLNQSAWLQLGPFTHRGGDVAETGCGTDDQHGSFRIDCIICLAMAPP